MRTSIVQKNQVSEPVIALIKRLVSMVPWPDRRLAQADVTLSLLNGMPRAAEDTFGWGRSVVKQGMEERQKGKPAKGNIANRHRKRIEEKLPHLKQDIQLLFDPHSQADARLSTTLRYLNPSASAVRKTLLDNGYTESELPTTRTISNLLNRLGYRLRSVVKAKPQKKNPGNRSDF